MSKPSEDARDFRWLERKARTIRMQRRKSLGPVERGFRLLGRVWSARLSTYYGVDLPDLPADIVDLMFVDLKTMRGSLPTRGFCEDDWVDMYNYMGFAANVARLRAVSTQEASADRGGKIKQKRRRSLRKKP